MRCFTILCALLTAGTAWADSPRSLVTFVETSAADQDAIRPKLADLLERQGSSLLDKAATDAAIKAFVPKGIPKADEKDVKELARQSGAERVVVIRRLPTSKEEKGAVFQVRVFSKSKVTTRLFTVDPASMGSELAKHLSELLPHQAIEEVPDEEDTKPTRT